MQVTTPKLHWKKDEKGKWWYQTPKMKIRYGGVIVKCEGVNCGNMFPKIVKRKTRNFCSKACAAATIGGFLKSGGSNHYAWKGGRIVTKKGYIEIYVPEHPHARGGKYVFEHRINMEKKLKRYLLAGEEVHHINGDKTDNRIENLELWRKSHPAGVRITSLHCESCCCPRK